MLSGRVSPVVSGRVGGVIPDLPSAGEGEGEGGGGAVAPGTEAPVPAPARIAGAAKIIYNGGDVLHANRMHAIFWAPAGSGLTFDPGYVALVQQFLAGVAADSHLTSNEYALTGQYSDSFGAAVYASTYAGSVLDTEPLPPNGCTEPAGTGPGWSVCLPDGSIQSEVERVIAQDNLPQDDDDVYIVFTPDGFGSCLDGSSASCALGGHASGYCGYHSSTDSGLLYIVVPYAAVPGHCQSNNPRPNGSTADPVLSSLSHEQIETITDPYGDAWIDGSGDEIADLCLRDYGRALGGSPAAAYDEVINGHHYWLQEIYSLVQHACEPRPAPDDAWVTLPAARVRAGIAATFTGHGLQPGGAVRTYTWTFGEGPAARGRVVRHVFAPGGRLRGAPADHRQRR